MPPFVSWIDASTAREKRALRRAIHRDVESALAAESPLALAFGRHESVIAFHFLLGIVHPEPQGRERLARILLDPRGTYLLPFRLSFSFGLITKHSRRHPRVDLDWIRKHKSAGALIALAILGACDDWSAATRQERAGVLLGDLVRRRAP